MKPDGSGERLLSVAFHNEAPTWAPNGRVILFFRQIRGIGKTPDSVQLYSVDITGKMEHRFQTPTDASHPAWSRLLR
jgi:TolB protein